MPTVTKDHGGTSDRFQAISRSVFQYEIASANMSTTPYAVGSDFQLIVQSLQRFGTIEMIGKVGKDASGGVAATKVVVFMSGNEDGVHPLTADLTTALTGATALATVTKIADYLYQGEQA